MLKKFALYLSRGFLTSFLLLLPAAFLFSFVLSQAAPVKKLVKDSGAYSYISRTVVESTVTSLVGSGQTYGLSEEAITRAAKKAFPPSDIEKKGDRLIAETYAWLEGDRPDYQPTVDLKSNQAVFTAELAYEAQKTFTAKPVCSDNQLLELSLENLLKSPCLPSNIDEDFLNEMFKQSIPRVSEEQAAGLSVDATSLKDAHHPNQESVGLASPQFLFSILKNSFYIVAGFSLVFLAIIFGLVRSLRPYCKLVAKSFGVVGILLLLYSLVMQWLLGQHFLEKIFVGNEGDIVQGITQPFAAISVQTNLYFAGGYIIGALLLVSAYRLLKPRQPLPLGPQPVIAPTSPPPNV